MSIALIPVGWPRENSKGGGGDKSSAFPNCSIAIAIGLTVLALAFTEDFVGFKTEGIGVGKGTGILSTLD